MKKINPKTDACSRGHYGQWRIYGGQHKCRLCQLQNDLPRRRAAAAKLVNLRLIYEATPGAVAKAAELLHKPRWHIHNLLYGWHWAPRWRVTQLRAVLELCILTNGNGHKA